MTWQLLGKFANRHVYNDINKVGVDEPKKFKLSQALSENLMRFFLTFCLPFERTTNPGNLYICTHNFSQFPKEGKVVIAFRTSQVDLRRIRIVFECLRKKFSVI